MTKRTNHQPNAGKAFCRTRIWKVVARVGERCRENGNSGRASSHSHSHPQNRKGREAGSTSLPVSWSEPERVELGLRVPRRRLAGGRRFIRLAHPGRPIIFRNFMRGQVVRAKGEFATDCSNAAPPGDFAPRGARQGNGPTRVAPPRFKTSSRSSACSSSFPRSPDFRFEDRARREPCPTHANALVIAITRTTPTTRTILLKQICPGGQRPDWLRVGPSDEVKFSVSSPRSRNSTAHRSQPRHPDL